MSVLEAMARAALDAEMADGDRFRNWLEMTDFVESEMATVVRAALAEARRQGWQLTPIEPNETMRIAGVRGLHAVNERLAAKLRAMGRETDAFRQLMTNSEQSDGCYRAMLSSAPSIDEV